MEFIEFQEERHTLLRSSSNPETQEHDDYDDESDQCEALSLCDLPIIHHQSSQDNEEHMITTPCRLPLQSQDDFDCDFDFDFNFDFCSLFKESQISAADDIFFQGQILPFRRCVSSTNRFLQYNSVSTPYFSGRSSSHRSSTSSGSSDPKQPLRNQFHSHPSPSPKILRKHQPFITSNDRNHVRKSWSWSVFRLGLIAAQPEIAFRDLKTRCSGKNSGGGRGKMSSGERKSVRAWDVVGGCKCAVDDTVGRETASFIKRSASDGERRMNKPVNHRTHEWLKQLSLHGAAAAER